MSESQGHSPRNFYNVPPLSAIVHGSKLISFEDGFFLPSSCHGRTWLLDDFQETCSETTSCKVPNCKQELGTEQSCMQSACLPRVFQTTCSSSRPCEKTICQSGRSSAMLACVSQPCQSGSSQKVIVQNCQPVSHVAKSCPPKTYLSKSCQTLECDPGQCQSQSPESGSCRPPVYVAPGPQLLESSSNTYEPTCCVTGGLQLPSK
ncbi:keratin-associated protein 27-1 [Prionailurus bengalensis]|uniref:keratin-associated protein 27-1 n=1 Tax=Prionailurus bengalensis TaxID=37029 RepID=UPI001CA97D6C|nr:keratin-associated protein 27-1 [Prionailurus bengalensis]